MLEENQEMFSYECLKLLQFLPAETFANIAIRFQTQLYYSDVVVSECLYIAHSTSEFQPNQKTSLSQLLCMALFPS